MARAVGQYYPAKSPVHALDPRAKIACSALFVVGLFLVRSLFGLLFVALVLAAFVALSRVPFSVFARLLRPVGFIVALTFLFQVFFSRSGDLLFSWGFAGVYGGGVLKGTFLAGRVLLLTLSAALLTATTAPVFLTAGLEDLLSPLGRVGFPAHEVAMMMTITLRFIPTLEEEAQKITRAQAARGAEFSEGGPVRRLRAVAPILIPLTVGAFRRADELAEALESRGYRGGEGRSRYRELRFRRRDAAAIFVVLVVLAVGALL